MKDSNKSALHALKSLLKRLQEEELRIMNEMGAVTPKPCICENRGEKNEQRKHCTELKEIRAHIRDISDLIKNGDVSYNNFPIFYNIELATRLSSTRTTAVPALKVSSL